MDVPAERDGPITRLPPAHIAADKAASPRARPSSARPHTPRPPWAPAQLRAKGATSPAPAAAPGLTGLPDGLKAGVEALSGLAMDDVRVHRNSAEPARLGALAFARGGDIHLAPGQEQHLPHEAWHVVQQKQGRVQATLPMCERINDDPMLEREADFMGARAVSTAGTGGALARNPPEAAVQTRSVQPVVQRKIGFEFETAWVLKAPANTIGMHTPVIRGTGWEVVPDRVDYTEEELDEMGIGPQRVHTGSGAMEFVTDAFEEDQVGPGGALDIAMQQITAVGTKLEAAPRGFFGTTLDAPLSSVIGNGVTWGASLALPAPAHGESLNAPAYQQRVQRATQRRDNILVRRLGGLAAAPQMTGGIKYDQLAHLLDRMSAPAPLVPGAQARPSSSLMAESDPGEVQVVLNKVVNARTIAGWEVGDNEILAGQAEAYAGFIALLGSYVRLADLYGAPPYDKAITPLLSRTDFGQLPQWARDVPLFINDVLLASGRYGAGTQQAMDGQGNDKLFREAGRHDAITTRGWLQAIVAGHDPIDWEQDRNAVKWHPQQVGMPGGQGPGHVYEFRRLEKGIELADWQAYALDMADLVVRANQGTME